MESLIVNGKHKKNYGFTFVELILVMAILVLITGLVTPNYFRNLKYSKEVVLKNNLQVIRRSIDDYYSDKGKYPASLEKLVNERYLRTIPTDPFTESNTTWKIVPPPFGDGVYDVFSGATTESIKGIPYAKF